MCKIVDLAMLLLLGAAGVMDWKKQEIPLWILILLSVVAGSSLLCGRNVILWERLAGIGLGAGFFGISKVTKEAIGYGDSWMILLLGIQKGIWQVLQILFVASLLAAVFALFYLWKRNWNKKATLPFLPFVVIGYVGVIRA